MEILLVGRYVILHKAKSMGRVWCTKLSLLAIIADFEILLCSANPPHVFLHIIGKDGRDMMYV